MYTPTRKGFLEKAKQGNLIPVWRELLADQDTPLCAYERMRQALRSRSEPAQTFLLESVEGGEHIARYSFLGSSPRAVLSSAGRTTTITSRDGNVETIGNREPLSVLKEHLSKYRPVPDLSLPRFYGGAVGYIGYDAVAQFERVPLCARGGTEWPDMMLAITDTIVVFDRARHTMKVVANALVEEDPEKAYDDAVAAIDSLCRDLSTHVPHVMLDASGAADEPEFRSNMTRDEFENAVVAAKEFIRAGDIIQVVLSQRFETGAAGDPLDVYRALRSVNPSPYMFCLENGSRAIVGSSPEVHVRCEDGRVELRPIAGTRPRSADDAEDQRLARELLADPKERAEHIMLVDLARNDLGRVCEYGSVTVPELMVIERYSHVMHIVSDVTGRLRADRDIYDLMRATFPAGTVSGAPKIRAMEIISELEAGRRGPYAGAVCYFGYSGNLDSCIAIRTVLMDGDKSCVQAGAGIVADSDPAAEYMETCNKARGMLKSLVLSRRFGELRGKS